MSSILWISFNVYVWYSSFRGLTKSHIYFNGTTSKWTLESLKRPDSYLVTNQLIDNHLPIGTHEWIVGDKSGLCKLPVDSKIELTFSACYPNKYTCNSGHCIALRYFSPWNHNLE